MPSNLQRLRLECAQASAYLNLCLRANISIEKGRKKQIQAFSKLLDYKLELGKIINATLTDEYHKGTDLISIDRVGQLTGVPRTDLLEILPELLTHHHHGYFKLSTLHYLTY